MRETRFTLILRSDTDDADEARQDALDFIEVSQDGWYSTLRLEGEIEVLERPDDDAKG